jgi:hypothetical protein
MLRYIESAFDERLADDHPRCDVAEFHCTGPKLRCGRSTPTEMESSRFSDFECFAGPAARLPSVGNGGQCATAAMAQMAVAATKNL